jgi:serine/threonine-protein kinase
MIGQTISHYRVLEKLGGGGMGVVYKAEDTRLHRFVALKFLPPEVARDPERMARFEREAKILASLNHPNIASIYGLEESNGVRALVMELVEGPTLAERPGQGPLPLDESLAIAKQIAEAMEYAHERGIIHRDLKPLNVKLTPGGQAKVLDFGLAKALEGEATEAQLHNSPTLSAAATVQGAILGTAAYMAPEQAKGKLVDRRADIWAFGCVLYEMLTGKSVFRGETTSDTLASVIRDEPDWFSLPSSVPTRIRELLRRCLRKDPKQRVQAIGDARITIEEALSGSSAAEAVPAPPLMHWLRPRGMSWALLAVVLALGMAIAGFIAWYLRPAPGERPVSRFAFAFKFPEEQRGAAAGFRVRDFPVVAVSPSGNELVYVAPSGQTTQVFLRPLDRLESQPLAGSANAVSPFFSRDGQWVGFFADGKLKKVSIHGGEPVTLCDAPMNRGGTWGPDGTIVFAPTLYSGLMRVSAAGGSPEILNTPDTSKGEISYRWPEILPGGTTVVFVVAKAKDIGFFTDSEIAVERLDTHEKKILPIQGTYPRYSSSGHLLFARDGRVFAVPFDLKRLEVTGAPAPALDAVKSSPNSGVVNFMVSDTGSLVYLPENALASDGILMWVDRTNQAKGLTAPTRAYGTPQISPDGQRVAVAVFSGNKSDVWVYEIARPNLTRLTFDEHSHAPIWSPDGKQIAFGSAREAGWEILVKPADGSDVEKTVVSAEAHPLSILEIPSSWSPDGKFLAYWTVGFESREVWIKPLQDEQKPQPFLWRKFSTPQARFIAAPYSFKFSPDGRWVAYTSDESGRFEVYVQPFPGPGGKRQISTDGGIMPVWARSGRELFFLSSNKLMSVEVTTQPSFIASTPRIVADTPTTTLSRFGNASYDVSADGQRFLLVKAHAEDRPPDEVRAVLNWTEELKRLVSANKQP